MHNHHGEYKSPVSKQLVLFSARGPWNDETMRHGVIKLSQHIETVSNNTDNPSKQWAQLSVLYGESLMPPSTFDIFIKQTRIRKTRGLAKLAVVIKDSDVAMTIRQQLRFCYDAAEIEYAFFDDIDTALNAINQAGLRFDEREVRQFLSQNDFSS